MRILPILLVCPFMTGCFAVAYPSVMETPAIAVPEPGVKAFRETYDVATAGALFGGCLPPGPIPNFVEIPITAGHIPAHCDIYLEYSYFIFPWAGSRWRAETVYLYRRGYETVKIEASPWLASWRRNGPTEVAWKKTETWQAQEKAIDDVSWIGLSQKTRAFLADELLMLSQIPELSGPQHEETRQRLEEKAKKMR